MTGVPIDEAGINEAIKAVHTAQAGIDSGPAKDCELCALLANEAVSAYLEAVGATVEGRWSTASVRRYCPPDEADETRVVLPWKPLTDTEEERSAPVDICPSCGFGLATSDGHCLDCAPPDTEEETDGC